MDEKIKKEILKQIIKEGNLKTAADISEVMSDLQGMLYQSLLDAEYEMFMEKTKSTESEKKNKKNVYTTKNPREIKTKTGLKTSIHKEIV